MKRLEYTCEDTKRELRELYENYNQLIIDYEELKQINRKFKLEAEEPWKLMVDELKKELKEEQSLKTEIENLLK